MPQKQIINHRYRLLQPIGKGGMGVVHRAFDRLTGATVALKQVLVDDSQLHFSMSNRTQNSRDVRLSLAREFHTLASLRHPHIISVLDYGFDDLQQPYYAMTLLEDAQTITAYARSQDDATRVQLIIQMLEALAYLHRRHIIHRDLKPDNVLVTPDGKVRVMDFGLASSKATANDNQSDTIVGTLSYMAPEILQQGEASIQSDLFAAGIIMAQILHGQHPFKGDTIVDTMHNILMQTQQMSALSSGVLESVIEGLLQNNPHDRYRSAGDVIDAISYELDLTHSQEQQHIRESYLEASQFVGRDHELKTLAMALQRVLDDDTLFYLIGGESGIGKSRLIEEIRTRALVAGALVVRGQSMSEASSPYQLWQDVVRHLCLTTTLDDLQAGILKDVVPDIGRLLQRDVPPAPMLAAEAQQQRLILQIVDLIRRQTRPLVILLEDLQWTGDGIAPLQQLLQIHEQLTGVLILATYRNDERPDLPNALPTMPTMTLDRLDRDAIEQLSASMLGEIGTQAPIVDLLQRETEGNAFFMVEVVRTLAEEAGSLNNIGKMTIPQHVLAGGVRQLIARRLQRVPAWAQAFLKQVAIAGRQLDLAVIAKLPAIPESGLEAWLQVCAEAAVIEMQDNQWCFSHDKIREAVLDTIADDEAPALHRQVARAIEATYGAAARRAEALYDHWYAAGDHDQAINYLQIVVDKLVMISAQYQKAHSLINQGLRLMTARDPRRVELLTILSQIYLRQGEYTKARQSATEALAIARAVDSDRHLSVSLHHLGIAERHLGHYVAAYEHLDESFVICEALDDDVLIADNLHHLGIVEHFQGKLRQARDYYTRSLALRQQIEHQRGIADSLNNLGAIAVASGDYDASRDYITQSMEIRREIGDQRGMGDSLHNLGAIALSQGDYADAATYFNQSLEIFDNIGDKSGAAMNLTNLGTVAQAQGKYSAARTYLQQSLHINEQINDQRGIASASTNLGGLAYRQEAYDNALTHYTRARAVYETIGDQRSVANACNNLGFVYAMQDDERSVALFTEALQRARDLSSPTSMLEALIGFGWIRLQQDNPAAAAELAGIVQAHPALNDALDERLQALIDVLRATLGERAYQRAHDLGVNGNFEFVVALYLAEFAQ